MIGMGQIINEINGSGDIKYMIKVMVTFIALLSLLLLFNNNKNDNNVTNNNVTITMLHMTMSHITMLHITILHIIMLHITLLR